MAVYGPWMSTAVSSWLTSLKAMLVTDAYVHDPDLQFRSQITTEVTDAGYTPGGVDVAGLAVSYDAAGDTVRITCDNVTFGAFNHPSVAGIVFYKPEGSAATDVLVAHDSWPAVEVLDAVNFVYITSPNGLVTLTGGA